MPKNNIYLPKENLARVEEVREIENKELITPEEQAQVINEYKERWGLIKNKSKLSPAARSKIIKKHGTDYLSERAFDHDIALSQMYGPGFWDSIGGEIVKKVGTAALAISYATPFVAVTGPVSIAVGVTGAAMATLSDDSDQRNVGRQMLGVVGEATLGHLNGDFVGETGKAKLIVEHIKRKL